MESTTATATATATVLLLGEESANRELLVEGLCRRGYQVLKARSAREAQRALNQQPGIVVVDQRVRGTNGLAWIRAMREDGHNMPVVYCSSSNCSVKTFNVLRNLLKVSLIVRKPLEPLRLIDQMESLLESPAGAEMDDLDPDLINDCNSQIQLENLVDCHGILQFSPPADEALSSWSKEHEAERETKLALEELGRSYLAEMPEILYELRAQVSASLLSEEGREVVQQASDTAHKIRGTAGSLGFPELSLMAGEIEKLLDDYRQAEGPEARQLPARALAIVAEIERWLEEWQDQNQRFNEEKSMRSEMLAAEGHPDASAGGRASGATVRPLTPGRVNAMLGRRPELVRKPHSEPVLEPVQKEGSKSHSSSVADFVDDRPELEPAQALAQRSPETPAPRTSGTKTIFIVDGNSSRSESLSSVIQSRTDCRVETFGAGLRVLTELEKCRADLLILDFSGHNNEEPGGETGSDGAGGLSGLDICRMIRCHPKWASLHIVVMTDDLSLEGRQSIFRCGANDFVVMPLVEEEIVSKVLSATK